PCERPCRGTWRGSGCGRSRSWALLAGNLAERCYRSVGEGGIVDVEGKARHAEVSAGLAQHVLDGIEEGGVGFGVPESAALDIERRDTPLGNQQPDRGAGFRELLADPGAD